MLRQQLLLLYAATSSPESHVGAWSMFDGTGRQAHMAGDCRRSRPYASVVAAMRDGWRVIQMSAPRAAAGGRRARHCLPQIRVRAREAGRGLAAWAMPLLASQADRGLRRRRHLRFDAIVPRAAVRGGPRRAGRGRPGLSLWRCAGRCRRPSWPGARWPVCWGLAGAARHDRASRGRGGGDSLAGRPPSTIITTRTSSPRSSAGASPGTPTPSSTRGGSAFDIQLFFFFTTPPRDGRNGWCCRGATSGG